MSKKITQLDEGVSLNKDEYYMIIAGNGENRKVKLGNLLMASIDNLEELKLITLEKIEEWDNKSDFDGDYNSLSNKPTIDNLVTETHVKNKYMSREEYNLLLKRIEDLEGKKDTLAFLVDIDGNFLVDIDGKFLVIDIGSNIIQLLDLDGNELLDLDGNELLDL